MLLNAEFFINATYAFRAIWFRGRYGGGKTLLAFAVADILKQKFNYRIYSNVPSVLNTEYPFPSPLPKCECGCNKIHAVIIYDEAWLGLGQGTNAKTIKAYMAYLRKQDIVMLMPSVLPLSNYAFTVWCERAYNLGILGIPLWIYRWGVRGKTQKESGGNFYLFQPSQHFGTYDTLHQPDEIPAIFADQNEQEQENTPIRRYGLHTRK